MNDKFKTVTSGLGYNHNHMTRGQNVKVFHGVECPRCKNQFLPTCVTGPAKCPSCGFEETAAQPRLTVRLCSFPESNGNRNWTALLVRVDEWAGLIGNCGGISVARSEFWNRVAYEAERAKLLIGERDTEPNILDYGDDIKTPEEWAGEMRGGRALRRNP